MIYHPATASEFNELISKGTTLVDFFATWCGPCKMIAPILENLDATKGLGETKIVKVDVDELQSIAAQYGIQSIPTLILFENGSIKKTTLGYQSKDQIISFVAK